MRDESAGGVSPHGLASFAAGLPLAVGLSCLVVRPASALACARDLTVAGGSRRSVSCDCGVVGRREVTYVNAAGDALAILDVDAGRRIFVHVVSGFGARNAFGEYIWWAEGSGASLRDVRHGPDAGPVAVRHESGR